MHLNCGGDTLLIPKFGRRHQTSLDHRHRNRRHDPRGVLCSAVPETHIVFEDSATGEGTLISGREFANLLAETGPTAVVLNACRSAHIGTPVNQIEDAPQNRDVALEDRDWIFSRVRR